ncbi:MAG: glycosyltransferase family 4 protein [Deltaproteobacteria bacterium]|nr:glycosyltransferase family 4 protein [Deltaproteobacteria bacterium]
MKVLQLVPELNEGGVERGVIELNREFVKRGIESVVVSAGGKLVDQVIADGGNHILFDVCIKNVLTVPPRFLGLRKIFERTSPDIIHARSRVPAWLAYIANKKTRIPFVTTVHGFYSVSPYSKVMTYGDKVICVSSAIKDYVQTYYQVPDSKIVLIPRGVDLELFNPKQLDNDFINQFKRKFGTEGRFVVTSVGRITQLKDYATFIRGVMAAKQKIPNICGLVVGGVRKDKKEYFYSLQKLVKELGAEDRIFFVESQKKIAEVYSLSDVVAICSKKPESFGRTAAEAIAMNVPVVTTNHGGVLDLVIPGETGFLFPPENVNSLVEALCLCQEQSFNKLRDKIENNFSLSKMVASTLDVYQALLN